MTAAEVTTLAQREIDEYRYDPPDGLIGTPVPEDRMTDYIAELQSKLIAPYKASFPDSRSYWIVTEIDETGMCVFYDDGENEFGLASGSQKAGVFEDINVRGDLVGSFAAR